MKKRGLFTLIAMFCLVTVTYAATSWSDAYTYSLASSDGWKTTTTQGVWMGQSKTDNNITYYDVNTLAKTMSSKPSFRLVNSDNAVRSGEVTTTDTGLYVRGYNMTGTAGFAYYGSVKPAWNQVGTDTIKLQMRIY